METNNSKNRIPLGLGLALSQNVKAMHYFGSLPEQDRKQIINHVSNIKSKDEMNAYVQSLTENKNWR